MTKRQLRAMDLDTPVSKPASTELRVARNSAEFEGIKANLVGNPSEQNLARYANAISLIMAAVE